MDQLTELDETPALTRPFTEASAIERIGDDEFTSYIDPAWTILGKPNGGYLLAILGRCAQESSSHSHVLAASSHYLRPPQPGEASIRTRVLRTGRTASQVGAALHQDGVVCVEALFTVGELSGQEDPYWISGQAEPIGAPFDECFRLEPGRNASDGVSLLRQVELMLDPASAWFTKGEQSGKGEIRGWLRLPQDEGFDPASLLFAIDSFPPATFDVIMSGWVPTLELTGYIRGLPSPGPVQVLQRATMIQGSRVDEACFVWDSAGRLVAQGTQLAGIRLP